MVWCLFLFFFLVLVGWVFLLLYIREIEELCRNIEVNYKIILDKWDYLKEILRDVIE